jgi:aspartyl-tRNA(Asn)/glutamyl-tRNA(Gln) amidotransferase subunit C
MSLSNQEFQNLSQLARINIVGNEEKKFHKQLGEILGYVDQLNELKTDKIKPTAQTTGLTNIMRKDLIDESLPSQEVFKNAPEQTEGFFKVKSVF